MGEYNLVDERWIPVVMKDGNNTELSLREIFNRSQDVVTITGDIPTQKFAIMRLLLAITHRSIAGPVGMDEWEHTWDNPAEAIQKIERYLDAHYDRFYLFHETSPFMQVNDLTPVGSSLGALSKIISTVPSNIKLFSSHYGSALESIPFAEATRWLIHTHAYDVSGIHTGMKGDPRVKKGKGYAIGTGWAGSLGGILVQGGTLYESLLKNLVPYSDKEVQEQDIPVWEAAPHTSTPENWFSQELDSRTPRGKVDVYTWQSRRIKMIREGDRVISAQVGNGDKIYQQNSHPYEPMTSWRYSKTQTKEYGKDVYMPLTHNAYAKIWDGLTATVATRKNGKDVIRAKNLEHAAIVKSLLEEDAPVLVEYFGCVYGPKDAVYSDGLFDAVTLPDIALADEDYGDAIVDAIHMVSDIAYLYRLLLDNIRASISATQAKDGQTSEIVPELFAVFESPFRDHVLKIRDSDINMWLDEWRAFVKKKSIQMGEEAVMLAGPRAMMGRMNKDKKATSSVVYLNIYIAGINRKLTPGVYQND